MPNDEGSFSPESQPERILESVERLVFTLGKAAFTMDELAGDLGMSKKTLYLHFPGKDAILGALVELMGRRMHAKLNAITLDPALNMEEKVRRVVETVGLMLARLKPSLLSDLKRGSPKVYRRMEELRRRNIPLFFGRLLEQGQREGFVRADIHTAFAAEFWFQAMNGLLDPESLERMQLSPRQTLERAVEIFFHGLLTEKGVSLQRRLAQPPPGKTPAH